MTSYRKTLDTILKSDLELTQQGNVLNEEGACAITLEDGSTVLLELSEGMDLLCLSTVVLPLPESFSQETAVLLHRALEFNVESGVLLGAFVAATREPATLICLSRHLMHPGFDAAEFDKVMTGFLSAASIARQVLAGQQAYQPL